MKIEKYISTTILDFLNENVDNYQTLDGAYFISRVPFFKSFENNSNDNNIEFRHYKNWKGNDKAILNLDKDRGFIEFPFLSVETKFHYYTVRSRDFESEEKLTIFKPMFKTLHYFIYFTDIHMDVPKIDEEDGIVNNIVALMLKEIIKDETKFTESFVVKQGEILPKDKLDNIFNIINRNLFKIEETLEKMKVSYF